MLLLALVGSALADISLSEFRKIPFTCSYLPGKSKVHLLFWFGIIPLVIAVHRAAQLKYGAMADPVTFFSILLALGFVAFAARMVTNRSAVMSGAEIQFEESPSDELVGLGLNL